MNLNRSAIHHLHPLDSLPEGGWVAFIEVPSWHFLQFLPSSSSQARIKSSMSWSILFIIIYVYYQQISDGTYKLMCVCACHGTAGSRDVSQCEPKSCNLDTWKLFILNMYLKVYILIFHIYLKCTWFWLWFYLI